jgi:hypothetical protein
MSQTSKAFLDVNREAKGEELALPVEEVPLEYTKYIPGLY